LQSRSPYINDINGKSSINGFDQHGTYQNGHHGSAAATNGHSVTPVANGVVTNGSITDGSGTNGAAHDTAVPALAQHAVTPNGAEVAQPSGVES
jgi:hypothetical protein